MDSQTAVTYLVVGVHVVIALVMFGRAALLAGADAPLGAGLSAFLGLAIVAAGVAIYRLRTKRLAG